MRSDFASYAEMIGPGTLDGAEQTLTSVITLVETKVEVAVTVTGGTTVVAVVVYVDPLAVMVTKEVIVDPGKMVREPGN